MYQTQHQTRRDLRHRAGTGASAGTPQGPLAGRPTAAHLGLRAGTPRPDFRLRPAQAEDAAALTDMLAGLSTRSSFLRFLAGLGRPSAQLVARLLRRDPTHGAWVAVVEDAPVGHVMWVIDGDAAEIGVVVTDLWQGRGVGRSLVQTALAEAAVAGACAVRADVHAENRAVLGMLRRAWPGAAVTREADLLTFRAPLRAAVPAVRC